MSTTLAQNPPTQTQLNLLSILDLGLPITDVALTLARKIHKDDTRQNKNKSPYIQHIEEVVVGTYHKFLNTPGLNNAKDRAAQLDACLAAAALHDAIEDHPTTVTREYLFDQLSPMVDGDTYYLNRCLDVIDNLTKKPKGEENYAVYLDRVSQDDWSLIIKLADLAHNLLDCEPGSRRDKYELSQRVLEEIRISELTSEFIQVD